MDASARRRTRRSTTRPSSPGSSSRSGTGRARRCTARTTPATPSRSRILAAGKAPIQRKDEAKDLVDELRYERPEDVEKAGLTKAALAETPWSDDYWGIYLGLLGRRYADYLYPGSDDWTENQAYVLKNPAAKIVASADQAAIDNLSPSEKYDLLVGDAGFGLTAAMWAEGKKFHDRSGSVETWMGICHGWAPASYMLARPRRMVEVKSPAGLVLRFFPADIRALASLLWANAAPALRFCGSRCEDKDPKKDEVGRVQSQAAFDNNPGTFYLAMVNQIGVSKRSMVLDATFDYEVWNQPLYSYEIHYFNPETMAFAGTAREGTVARGDFRRDKFTRYRSKDYKAALGVAMRTRYVVEVPPTHAPTSAATNDSTNMVDYYFDLELDGSGRIIGGEWYLNRHPDFLWTPSPEKRAWSPADDFAAGEWDGKTPVPAGWQSAAARASADGIPLAKVVERLIALAAG
ncbi:MAG: hypothetical protein QM820_47875 [Minicystis sp.]